MKAMRAGPPRSEKSNLDAGKAWRVQESVEGGYRRGWGKVQKRTAGDNLTG